jgi:AraC-like DNA-binding protein
MLIERAGILSRDLDEVQDLMTRRYVEHHTRVIDGADGFVFRSQSARAGALTVDHLNYRATMAISAQPFASTVVVSVLDGVFGLTAGRQHSRTARGGSLLYLPHVSLDLVMDRMIYQVVQFPAETVTRVAARLGVEPADFRFDAMAPVSETANRQWLATVAYLTRLLADRHADELPDLLLTAAMEAAATAALSVFPNTTMTVDQLADPGRVAPGTVRRAVAHIEAHAAEPVTLEEIAASAGVGVRALQAAFRRHLDTTPLAHLRRVRLDRAHRDLQAADPTSGATVTGIAHRWGFADLSRFGAYYREAFGRPPSHTLHT